MNEAAEHAHRHATRELPPARDPLDQVSDLIGHWLALRRLGVMTWRQVFAKILDTL